MEKEQFIFIGDSLVADFDWQKRMPFFNVVNLGVPGETAQGLLNRLDSMRSEQFNPRVILLTIGTNNVLSEDFSFIPTLDKIIIHLSNSFTEAEIIVNSLFPIQVGYLSKDTITRINDEIEELTRKTGSCFLNMFDRLKDSDAALFQEDGVHLTGKAYDLWARSIMETLAFLLEDD